MTRYLNEHNVTVFDDAKPDLLLQFSDFIGVSQVVSEIRQQAADFAADPRGTPVLITGERGTGKDLLAAILHYNSVYVRDKKVLLILNCGALHGDTLHSQLFGHRRGAFTGAYYDREGYFRAAKKGTLFLNEIGTLSLWFQTLFLRAIESRCITPLGIDREVGYDAQLIFATNKSFEFLSNPENFKEDLLDRMMRRHIHIPPLSQRKEDIVPLTDHLVGKICRSFGSGFNLSIDQNVYDMLMNRDFPGNVRMLENVIDKAVFQCWLKKKERLSTTHFPENNSLIHAGMKDKNSFIPAINHAECPLMKDLLETKRHEWEGKKSDEVSCIQNMDEHIWEKVKQLYLSTGRNKSVTAHLLGMKIHHLRNFKA
jgi:DNA-binding NtrC family response regulator